MNKMRRGKLNLPTEDLEAEMFDYIIQELEKNGFEHYRFLTLPNLGWRVVTISCTGIMMNIMVWVLGPLVMSMVFVIAIEGLSALPKGYS